MNSVHRLTLALLLATLLPSCLVSRSTFNEPLVRPSVDSLVPGQSTASDVVLALGAPTEVVQLGRRSAYRYDFANEKRAGFFLILVAFLNTDTRTDRVWVFFDEEDLLTHVGSTFEAGDAAYAMPWVKIHD